jgi:hypothetical protein
MSERVELGTRPTADQLARFRTLSPSARYAWLASMLELMHGLATDETRLRWRALRQAESGGFLGVATGFARALDHGDFQSAARCLSSECVYQFNGKRHRGVEAVIGAYRENHTWAERTLERVEYRSHVEGLRPGDALVTFEDRIEHRGQRHLYRCQQELSVGRSRLIETITNREMAGERASLAVFFDSIGVRR